MGFSEDSSESAVFFSYDTRLEESGRTVRDPALGPAFDQIAQTITVHCQTP